MLPGLQRCSCIMETDSLHSQTNSGGCFEGHCAVTRSKGVTNLLMLWGPLEGVELGLAVGAAIACFHDTSQDPPTTMDYILMDLCNSDREWSPKLPNPDNFRFCTIFGR